jgi:hypothetical protein
MRIGVKRYHTKSSNYQESNFFFDILLKATGHDGHDFEKLEISVKNNFFCQFLQFDCYLLIKGGINTFFDILKPKIT